MDNAVGCAAIERRLKKHWSETDILRVVNMTCTLNAWLRALLRAWLRALLRALLCALFQLFFQCKVGDVNTLQGRVPNLWEIASQIWAWGNQMHFTHAFLLIGYKSVTVLFKVEACLERRSVRYFDSLTFQSLFETSELLNSFVHVASLGFCGTSRWTTPELQKTVRSSPGVALRQGRKCYAWHFRTKEIFSSQSESRSTS